MKRLWVLVGLLTLFGTYRVWGKGAPQTTLEARPPAISFFQTGGFFTLPTVNQAEQGELTIDVVWQTTYLTNDYRLELSAFQYQTWVSLLEPNEVLAPNGQRSVPLHHPLNFGLMVYRLAIMAADGSIHDQQFVMVDYQRSFTPVIVAFSAITLTPSTTTFDVEVAWQIENRLPNSNLEFDQLLPDGSSVSAELPRHHLWVPSQGTGLTRLRYTNETNAQLRLRVVDVLTNETLAEALLSIPMPSATLPPTEASMTPVVLSASQTPTPSSVPPTITPTPRLADDAPRILSFRTTGGGHETSPYISYQFIWETEHAVRVSLESGYIQDGVFYGGGWHYQDNLPPNGTGGFMPKIQNYAARLCVVEPVVVGATICAVCNPQEPTGCR